MKELDSKQRAFVLYAAKILKCSSPEELDRKLQGLSEDELNNLVQSFDQLYNQQMENNTIMARLGSKLNYIQKLNNKCPEGYEIEYYRAGGELCSRCRQGAIPMAAKKNGGVAKDIKAEIAKCGCKAKKKKAENGTVLDKCGGKAKKKKMQDGGKSNYDTKKVAENIKKHLNGGLIQKYRGGRPISQVGTSDPSVVFGRTLNESPQFEELSKSGKGYFPTQLEEVVVSAPKIVKPANPLGGGLYQWMVENGLGDLASFQNRKKLAARYGILNYIGTAQQNTELQKFLDADLKQAEISGGRLGLRKGLDY